MIKSGLLKVMIFPSESTTNRMEHMAYLCFTQVQLNWLQLYSLLRILIHKFGSSYSITILLAKVRTTVRAFYQMCQNFPSNYPPIVYRDTCYYLGMRTWQVNLHRHFLPPPSCIRGRSFFILHTRLGEIFLNSQKCFIAPIKKIKNVS